MSEPLRIGLLSSHTGPLAPVERSVMCGALLAIEQVNAQGGVRGHELVPVIADYASDTSRATVEARRLLRDEGVRIIIGGYTSASRVAIQPALHDHDGILFYPTYFEGLELDPRTVYAGAVPNQFLIDYVEWVIEHLGDRLYMVGSDYIYPRTAAAVVRRVVEQAGGRIVADRYVPLGQTDFGPIVDELGQTGASVVLCNLVGVDSVPAFYRQFRLAGHGPGTLPIAATVTTELDLRQMGPPDALGHYMTGSYFSTVPGPANAAYLAALRSRFGTTVVAHAAQVGLYNGVRLLAAAGARVDDLRSTAQWLDALPGTTVADSPEAHPIVVAADLHTTHPSHIGRADAHGTFEILHSWAPRAADPYPSILVSAPPAAAAADGGGALAPGEAG